MSDTGTRHAPGSALEDVGPPPPPNPSLATGDHTPPGGSPRVRGERVALWVSAAIALVVPAVAALDLSLPGRPVLAVLFILVVPGVPLASLLRLPNALLAASLAGAMSIACTLLMATAELGTGWWNPVVAATILAAASLIATVPALKGLADRPAAPAASPIAADQQQRGPIAAWDRPVSGVLLAAALVLWWLATRWVNLDATGAVGLIGVIGWAYGLAVLTIAAVAAYQLLRPRLDVPMLTATAVTLTLVVFAFVNVADGEGSVPSGWLHVGFIRFIAEHHVSFTGLDARAEWPAFFAAGANLVRLAGVPDASTFLPLAPFFYNTLAIAPLLVIARCITRSRRLAWLAVFIYLGANWFQQDYFAPQATAFLLYLVTLALLLWSATTAEVTPLVGRRWSRMTGAWRRRPGLPPGTTARQSLLFEGALLLLAAAIVVSHQLTPILLVLTTLAFAISGHTRHRRLWLLASLLFLGWFSYAASGFWIGHLGQVLGDLGRIGANLNRAVGARGGVDPTYQNMQYVRLAWSLLYGILALVGLWSIRRRPDAVLLLLLVGGAAGLVGVQSYGGEVVLRSFVFAAPVLAPLAALALRALTTRRGLVATLILTGVLTVYGLAVTTTRGVNVSFERVPQGEVAAVQSMFDRMGPNSSVGVLTPTGAIGSGRIGDFSPVVFDAKDACVPSPVACAVASGPDFILISRTQDAVRQVRDGDPPGGAFTVADDLVASGVYTVVYRGHDAEVLQRIEGK